MAGARKKRDKVSEAPAVGPTAMQRMGEAYRRFRLPVHIIAGLLFFGYMLLITTNLALNDPDIFWHIKTGDYIIKNWEVPEVDPFAYTTPRPLAISQKIGLRSQWLGQVIYQMAYIAGGMNGVVVFRNVLVIMPTLILFLWMLRHGMGFWGTMLLTSFTGMMFTVQLFYSFERPQGISFSLVLLCVILVDRLRQDARTPGFKHSYWMLPTLMAVWSNIHAGFIVGCVIIVLYIAGEAMILAYHRLRGAKSRDVRPVIFVVCGLAILASMLNPNGHHLFLSYTVGMVNLFFTNLKHLLLSAKAGVTGAQVPAAESWVRDVVLEFKPLHYFYTTLNYKWLMFYWIFTVILYAFLLIKYWVRKSLDLGELFALSIVVFFANYHARGLMFSLAIMPYFLARGMYQMSLMPGGYATLRKMALASTAALTIAFVTYTYSYTPFILKPKFKMTEEIVSPWYPTHLVDFLKKNPIRKPMYNYYTWGGYLIWALYPDYQVFIDGRAIDDTINRTADDILKTQGNWSEKLDAYDINFVVIPLIFRESGHIIPLATAMAEHPGWKLVFLRNNAALFVRNVRQNEEFIRKYSMDKRDIYRDIITVENILLTAVPDNPIYNISKSDALFALGRYKEALTVIQRFRNHPAAPLRIRQLEQLVAEMERAEQEQSPPLPPMATPGRPGR